MSIRPRRCFAGFCSLQRFINWSNVSSIAKYETWGQFSKKLVEAGESIGKAVLLSQQENKKENSKKQVEDLSFAFPGLSVEQEEIEEEDTEICIFLFADKEPIYQIYSIARLYLDENYSLDSAILLRLIDKKDLDIEQALLDIFLMHSGYVDVILQDMKNGRESDQD